MNTKKILVLEEEIVVAEDIRDCLQNAGYEVERTSSLSDALKKSSEFKPDLVLIGVVCKLDSTVWHIELHHKFRTIAGFVHILKIHLHLMVDNLS